MRTAEITRNTNETEISLKLNIDGQGKSQIDTGCGFLDHMLTLFARHGDFDLCLNCKGDYKVDYHHTTEDVGIALGEAFKNAMGEKLGIVRYGSIILPMDEALVLASVDVSGRSFLSYKLNIPTEKVGDFDTELVKEFFLGFVRKADICLHLNQFDGENSHHIIEAGFKAFARALSCALKTDEKHLGEVPSTKGML